MSQITLLSNFILMTKLPHNNYVADELTAKKYDPKIACYGYCYILLQRCDSVASPLL